MHLVGLYTYCKMMHGAYIVKLKMKHFRFVILFKRRRILPEIFVSIQLRASINYFLISIFRLFWILYSLFWVNSRSPNFKFQSNLSVPFWRRWNRPGVPKCRHIKFRCRRITQKKEYNKRFIVHKFILL